MLLRPEAERASRDWWPERFRELERAHAGRDKVNRASAFELQTYMLSTLLRDADQMGMAHSLEIRVPLIDSVVVELMFTIPGEAKLDATWPKPLLSRPLGSEIPKECIFRPKQGFVLPTGIWMRGALHGEVRDALLAESRSGPFSPAGLRRLWEGFENGKVGWSRVWAIFMLLHWIEEQQCAS
jgi:asparagine synthase (glutamine-hydrolysing)